MIKAKLPANIKDHVDIRIIDNTKATVSAKANSNYKGNVEVSYILDNRMKTQQGTIYIDKDGKQITTSERDLSKINSKEIIQIGFYKNEKGEIQVVRMPLTVEKVPNRLPSQITSINKMFWKCKSFNQDISGWDTSKVTDMSGAFQETKFNQDISGWDVSNVTDMSEMFRHNKSFNQDISGWDTSKVTDMSDMFGYHRYFDQDLSKWNVEKVTKHKDFADWSKIANTNKLPRFRNV